MRVSAMCLPVELKLRALRWHHQCQELKYFERLNVVLSSCAVHKAKPNWLERSGIAKPRISIYEQQKHPQ
jgi:hypothetical protein